MIIKNGKTISSIYKGSQVIDKIYKGTLVVYESWKNLIASGVPPLKLLNCKGVDLVDYKIYGESIQKLDASNMTNIWDGTYTTGQYYDANGNLVELSSITMSNMMELTYKKYDVTCINNGGVFFNFRFNYFDENKNWLSQTIIGVNPSETIVQEIEVPNDAKYINFSVMNIVINAGHKISPSSNNVPTPTAPIEVESVGDKTKNLVDWDYLLTSSVVSKVENGYYAENYGTTITAIAEHLKEVLKPNVTYTLSRVYEGEVDASNGMIGFVLADKSSIMVVRHGQGFRCGTFSLTQEQIDNISSLRTYFHKSGATISELQLIEGEYTDDTMPSYEPYGYKIPVKVSGKNLFNINIYGDFKDTTNLPYVDISNLEVGKKITITSTKEYLFKIANTSGSSTSLLQKSGTSITFTLTQQMVDCGHLYIISTSTYSAETKENLKAQKVQMEYGTATEYEPYIEPVTTNIYLKEPLRKMDIYADYIDFENKILYRAIKQKQINGNSSLSKFSGVTLYSAFFVDVSDLYRTSTETLNVKVLADKFKYHPCTIANTNERWTSNYQIGGVTTASYKRICFTLPTTITTTTEAKAWLKDNPVNYFYPSATPIEETIELPNIPTIKGTTLLSIDTKIQPSNMEVVYKGK